MKTLSARIFLPVTLLTWAVLAAAGPVRAATVDTEIVGINDKEIVKNIEASLSIIRDKKLKDLTDANVAQMHDRAPVEIKKAVEPFGYYGAIVAGKLTPEGNDKFKARYVVTLGAPVHVRDVHIEVTGEGRDREPF